MKILVTISAVLLSAAVASAQTPAPSSAANPLRRTPAEAAPAEPAAQPGQTPRQAAIGNAKERRKRCSAEWRTAKAGGGAGGQKWPQFFSGCNARLKSAGV